MTQEEIFRQPLLWRRTLEQVRAAKFASLREATPTILTGAGTSAYAAAAVAASWPGGRAVPTTDLLLYTEEELQTVVPGFAAGGLLISLARSGDSPESLAVVSKIQQVCPRVRHLVITCNAEGGLARLEGAERIILDPRTNDRSLAMTSSFSNLTLAGLALRHGDALAAPLPAICQRAEQALPSLDDTARELASTAVERVVVLASEPLRPLATEAALKILEMTAGKIAVMPESFLGLRHGPMSFLRADSLVLCFLSSHPNRRRYEQDLIRELHNKSLGRIVIAPAQAPDLPDHLRVPFEIPFGQLLAYRLSLANGLDPDNPSPDGVITRVVPRFRMHEEPAPGGPSAGGPFPR
jgi:tagatose-6-phosphate ketose/aldose isomerase